MSFFYPVFSFFTVSTCNKLNFLLSPKSLEASMFTLFLHTLIFTFQFFPFISFFRFLSALFLPFLSFKIFNITTHSSPLSHGNFLITQLLNLPQTNTKRTPKSNRTPAHQLDMTWNIDTNIMAPYFECSLLTHREYPNGSK